MYHCMSMTKLSLDGLNKTKVEFENLNIKTLWINSPPMKPHNLDWLQYYFDFAYWHQSKQKKKIKTILYDNLKHTEKSCDWNAKLKAIFLTKTQNLVLTINNYYTTNVGFVQTNILMNCKTFLSKSLAEKKASVVKDNLCFTCLSEGHVLKKLQVRFFMSYWWL